MALSAQDKILYVANKLGLSTLGQMQGSTGAVYDVDTDATNQIFSRSSQHGNPNVTNLNDNRFEVNEALLVETVSFFAWTASDVSTGVPKALNLQRAFGSEAVVVFDLVIGNKTVIKDSPVFAAGQPNTFSSIGIQHSSVATANIVVPRNQIFMEGAGILIPPQVDFYINYKVYSVETGAVLPLPEETFIGAYLFGTKVNLNFNTTL